MVDLLPGNQCYEEGGIVVGVGRVGERSKGLESSSYERGDGFLREVGGEEVEG